VIALDRQGRKFANCTSLEMAYAAKNDGNLQIVPEGPTRYIDIAEFVN